MELAYHFRSTLKYCVFEDLLWRFVQTLPEKKYSTDFGDPLTFWLMPFVSFNKMSEQNSDLEHLFIWTSG